MENQCTGPQTPGSSVGPEQLGLDFLNAYTSFFRSKGLNPHSDGLKETPARVLKALLEMTRGYDEDPAAVLGTTFESKCDEMVIVKGMPFVSLCEHHLLPFFGHVDVAYVPAGRVVGLSKIPRAVQALARRLQIQERFTEQIAGCLATALSSRGVAVRVTATHSCMQMRGIESEGEMVTVQLNGVFRKPEVRSEFLANVRE